MSDYLQLLVSGPPRKRCRRLSHPPFRVWRLA